MSSSETHLSRAAFDRLQAEVEQLTTEGRVDVARRIEAARALGDLSENGDYHAAKDDQGKMEARIRQLEALLKTATIVEEGTTGDVIGAGSVVGLRYVGEGNVERFLVGSIEERRDDVEVVSPGSPLGVALLGHRAGETVSYQAPNGKELEVEVVTVGG